MTMENKRITGIFSSLGNSNIILPQKPGRKLKYDISGSFSATVVIEVSLGGGAAWVILKTIASIGTGEITVGEKYLNHPFRLRCSVYSSGSINYKFCYDEIEDSDRTSALVVGAERMFAPMPRAMDKVQEVFASGHGYTKQSAEGTQSDDTTVFKAGAQSLKLVSDAAGSAVFTRSGAYSPTLDFTGKDLTLKLRIDDISLITELWVFATSDSFVANWFTWQIEDMGLSNYTWDGEWLFLKISFADAGQTGTPDLSAIDKIQLRIKDDSASAVTVNFQSIGMAKQASEGCVVFSFDDGWESQYTEAKKKLSEYGFPAIAYCISNLVDTSGYMTLGQFKELQNLHQWEIGVHHQTNLTTLGVNEIEAEIIKAKKWAIDNNLESAIDHFSIPNGAFNADILKLLQKYFRTSRTIAEMTETMPPSNPHRLRIKNVINSTTTGSIATLVDNARIYKGILILNFHKIVTSPSVSTEYSIANFATVVDDIAADGISVKTLSQAIIDA